MFIERGLVKRLVAKQFPKWKDLPILPVAESGWDHKTFHLGKELLIRMPSAKIYEPQVVKEQLWLPTLAPLLPLHVPSPVAIGKPSPEYPMKWSIYRWIEGKTVSQVSNLNVAKLAIDLAHFLKSLQKIDTKGAPISGLENFHRGGDLSKYSGDVEQALTLLKGRIETKKAEQAWKRAIATSWKKKPVWVHGDISSGNLLMHEEKLFAVIDFGLLSVGDPACDLSIAWTFFRGAERKTFLNEMKLGVETEQRGYAWALWKALLVEANMTETNAAETKGCKQVIAELYHSRTQELG